MMEHLHALITYLFDFPALSLLGLSLTWLASSGAPTNQWLASSNLAAVQETSAWLACISLSPLCELVQSWRDGGKNDYLIWSEFADGLLEASSSVVLTLLMVFEGRLAADFWSFASVLSSLVSMTNAATQLV